MILRFPSTDLIQCLTRLDSYITSSPALDAASFGTFSLTETHHALQLSVPGAKCVQQCSHIALFSHLTFRFKGLESSTRLDLALPLRAGDAVRRLGIEDAGSHQPISKPKIRSCECKLADRQSECDNTGHHHYLLGM